MGNKIAKFASPRSQNDRCSISLKRKRSTDIDSSDEEQEMHTAKRYIKRNRVAGAGQIDPKSNSFYLISNMLTENMHFLNLYEPTA